MACGCKITKTCGKSRYVEIGFWPFSYNHLRLSEKVHRTPLAQRHELLHLQQQILIHLSRVSLDAPSILDLSNPLQNNTQEIFFPPSLSFPFGHTKQVLVAATFVFWSSVCGIGGHSPGYLEGFEGLDGRIGGRLNSTITMPTLQRNPLEGTFRVSITKIRRYQNTT